MDNSLGLDDKSLQKMTETNFHYILRFSFLLICTIALIAILIFSILILIFLCMRITMWMTGKGGEVDEDVVMRNGRLINMMSSIPYSTFML